ncbi:MULTISPECIES: hypothetical protein [unclassified Prochlorococcus]|uniref:hypothetical protein n=1 Tax=unclassified Prochlorococcus TaxID=2627481 RepID=UPI001F4C752B|nr:hypothetical protein [Prochlorococcus sp. MIT 0703]
MSSIISTIHDASRLKDAPQNPLARFWRARAGSGPSTALKSQKRRGYGRTVC